MAGARQLDIRQWHFVPGITALPWCKELGEVRREALILSLGTLEDVDVVREVQDFPTTHMVWKPRAFHPPWLWFGPRGKGDHSSRSVITFKSSQQPLWPGACPGE